MSLPPAEIGQNMLGDQQKPIDCAIRLLLAFHFRRSSNAEASKALETGRVFGMMPIWKASSMPHGYRDELSPQATGLLLGTDSPLGGAYFKSDSARLENWFPRGTVVTCGRKVVEASVHGHGAELFLSGHGVGVLSFTIAPASSAATSDILDMNHRLCQLERASGKTTQFLLPDPASDTAKWAKIPETDRTRILARPIPDSAAPIDEQLGARGGRFSPRDFLVGLLQPLSALELEPENQLVMYSALRFGQPPPAFETVEWDAARLAAKLAQAEEAVHAGATKNGFQPTTTWLNANHLAAICSQGAAHLVIDQADVPFNAERLSRVRDKYLVPFLIALMARTLSRRLAVQACEAASAPDGDREVAVDGLRHALLDFSLSGTPSEVSTRAVLNAYYDLCNRALDPGRELTRVHDVLTRLDEFMVSRRTEALTLRATQAAEASISMQANLEWVEIFVVFIYSVELAHLGFSFVSGDHPSVAELAGVTAFGALAAAAAALILRPWKHRRH